MSLEFVACSDGNEEILSLCINSIVIEDREDRLLTCENAKTTFTAANLTCLSKTFACFEILLGDGLAESKVLVAMCKNYEGMRPIALVRFVHLLNRRGIKLFSICNTNETRKTITFLCQWKEGDLVDLIRLLIDSHYDNQTNCTSWNVLKALCSHYSNSHQLIAAISELGDRGIEIVRLQCDILTNVDRTCDLLFSTFAYLMNRISRFKYQSLVLPLIIEDHVLSITASYLINYVLSSIPVTLKIRFSPLLTDREIFICKNDTECCDDEQSLLRFNTLQRKISIPSYKSWQSIHRAWHSSETFQNPRNLVFDIFDYLDKNSHDVNCCSPSLHKCKWCEITTDIDEYLERLMNQVQLDNALFEVEEIIKYGSSAENTNVFHPSEFDRGIILKNFRQSASSHDPYQIVYIGNDPDRASLKDEKFSFNSSCLFYEFMKVLQDAVDRIYSVHVFAPTVVYGETCLTISFVYRCRSVKSAMHASVDLTIAVRAVNNGSSMGFLELSSCWFQSLAIEEFLVPNRRGCGEQWQPSYPTLEREIFLHAGPVVKRVYQLLKLLVALQSNVDEREIPQKSCVSSYALKTCLFRYMRYHFKPPPWQHQDILLHAYNIMKQFPMSSTKMTSFFVKNSVAFEVTKSSKDIVKSVIDKLQVFLKHEKLISLTISTRT